MAVDFPDFECPTRNVTRPVKRRTCQAPPRRNSNFSITNDGPSGLVEEGLLIEGDLPW